MSAAEWAIVIAAGGTVALQVLGRLQAWQLAVIALRSEVKGDSGRAEISVKVDKVQRLVDGNTTRMEEKLQTLQDLNTSLAEQLRGFVERDATTAQLAREAAMKGIAPASIAGGVLGPKT